MSESTDAKTTAEKIKDIKDLISNNELNPEKSSQNHTNISTDEKNKKENLNVKNYESLNKKTARKSYISQFLSQKNSYYLYGYHISNEIIPQNLKEALKYQKIKHRDKLISWATIVTRNQLIFLNLLIVIILGIVTIFMIKSQANTELWILYIDKIFFFLEFYVGATFVELLTMLTVIVRYVFGKDKKK